MRESAALLSKAFRLPALDSIHFTIQYFMHDVSYIVSCDQLSHVVHNVREMGGGILAPLVLPLHFHNSILYCGFQSCGSCLFVTILATCILVLFPDSGPQGICCHKSHQPMLYNSLEYTCNKYCVLIGQLEVHYFTFRSNL
jgi:CBS domain containing-hemolysin-like protein